VKKMGEKSLIKIGNGDTFTPAAETNVANLIVIGNAQTKPVMQFAFPVFKDFTA